MFLISRAGSFLNLRDQVDRAFLILITLGFGSCFVNSKQLPVAQVFLNDHAALTVDRINLRDRNRAFQKESRDVEIRMEFGVKRLWIDRRNGLSFLPGNAKVIAR